MELLKQRILKDGKLLEGNILKVDNFLNHQIDVQLLNDIGKEFFRLYGDCGVNKILTIEASGIAIACITAQYFDVPVVFAKKSKSTNISNEFYRSSAHSYTHGTTNEILVSKEFLSADDRILIIDDFLANGKALTALLQIIEDAGATAVGAGIVIEKAFQEGGNSIRSMGIRVESLARVRSMDTNNGIVFED